MPKKWQKMKKSLDRFALNPFLWVPKTRLLLFGYPIYHYAPDFSNNIVCMYVVRKTSGGLPISFLLGQKVHLAGNCVLRVPSFKLLVVHNLI